MRSLSLKLTLAFMLVGLIGAGAVAGLVYWRTQNEFSQFIASRNQDTLINALTSYYSEHGAWDGVEAMLQNNPELALYRNVLLLRDAQGGTIISPLQLPGAPTGPSTSIVLTSADQTIGVVNIPPQPVALLPPPDRRFLERVTWATATSALLAMLSAILVGGWLAQRLAQPIHDLIRASRRLAQGEFGSRVTVRSRDEVGELAQAFNAMSADLERASQLRTQMTADLAHDLRTPLSILRGYTEGLKDARISGAPPIYAVMHEEVEYLQHLVDDLRVLSLTDSAMLPLNRRIIDPLALLERTGLAYIMQAEQRGIQLTVTAAPDLPSIYVDTERMTQVLNNLVSNALRHTSGGAIGLSAQASATTVQLSIHDTGSGIAASDLPFIFDRFYRADKARQREASGPSGLGLAIVKAIVEAHDGSIRVTSRVGHGTQFTITLARHDICSEPAEQISVELSTPIRATRLD